MATRFLSLQTNRPQHMKVKTAKGPIAWYMRACGFYGWASFWRTVYVLPGWDPS